MFFAICNPVSPVDVATSRYFLRDEFTYQVESPPITSDMRTVTI